jgi:L-arabinose isomerase
MIQLSSPEIWFVTGSQHLYGPETLAQVARNSEAIVAALGASKRIPLKLVFKPVLKTPDEIRALCLDANHAANCAGLVLWMHTFSPSKMWIRGLTALKQAVPAPPHAVQPRPALVDDRHGFHEPQPGRARRP